MLVTMETFVPIFHVDVENGFISWEVIALDLLFWEDKEDVAGIVEIKNGRGKVNVFNVAFVFVV